MDSIEQLKLEGNKLYAQKDFDGAIKKYSEALLLNSLNDVILSNRSAVYISLKEYELAASDAVDSLKINAGVGNAKAYYRLASAYHKLNNCDMALTVIKNGLDAFTDETDKVLCESMILQSSSLKKLEEIVKQDQKKERLRRRKEMFFGGNLTECVDCVNGLGVAVACAAECCVNNDGETISKSTAVSKSGKSKPKTSVKSNSDNKQTASKNATSSISNVAVVAPRESPVYTPTEYDMYSELKSIIRKISDNEYAYSKVSSGAGSGGAMDMLSGTFHKLVINENSFQETLFPGCSSSVRKSLPKSLKDLLLWKFDLTGESGSNSNQQQQVQLLNTLALEEELYPRIIKSAAGVFDNLVAKSDIEMKHQLSLSRGKAPMLKPENDPNSIHYPATRTMLITQIVQEALAREIVNYVHAQNRKLSGIKARTMLQLAVVSPQHAKTPAGSVIAQCNHLSSATVDKLKQLPASSSLTVTKPLDSLVCVQDGFMNEDWVELLSDDLQRYITDEKMTTVNSRGSNSAPASANSVIPTARMCWVDRELSGSGDNGSNTLSITYPAITELLDKLHALPYEINRKTNCSLELLEPTRGTTLLVYYPAGCVLDDSGYQMDSNLLSGVNQSSSTTSSSNAVPSSGSVSVQSQPQQTAEDTGFRVSCTYFIMESTDALNDNSSPIPTQFVCRDVLSPNAAAADYPVTSDRLIIFPSTRIQHQLSISAVDSKSKNEQSTVNKVNRGFFKLCYYIHGRK